MAIKTKYIYTKKHKYTYVNKRMPGIFRNFAHGVNWREWGLGLFVGFGQLQIEIRTTIGPLTVYFWLIDTGYRLLSIVDKNTGAPLHSIVEKIGQAP